MIGPLPHSPDAEKAILGAILVNNDNLDRVLAEIDETKFFFEPHRIIFKEIRELAEKGSFDTLVLIESLKRKELLQKVGGASYVSSLTDGVFEDIDIEPYLDIVIEDAKRRRIIEEAEKAIERASKKLERAEEIVAEIQEGLFKITEEVREGYFPVEEAGEEALRYAQMAKENQLSMVGVPSGFSDLDRKTTGFHEGELIIIAGRPGMGKTALALSIALNAAMDKDRPRNVGMFSLEMSKLQLGMRLLSMISRVDMQRIREGTINKEELKDLTKARARIKKLGIFIDTTSSLTTTEILARARRMKKEKNVDLIIVDYLQLLRVPGVRDRVNEVGIISRTMKEMAKSLSIPVIALSQLNREPEKRASGIPRPRLSDLRESGSLEQDADVVIMLYRDEYYDKGKIENKGIAEIRIEKQRQGPPGVVLLGFAPTHSRFFDIPTEVQQDYWRFMETKERRGRRRRRSDEEASF